MIDPPLRQRLAEHGERPVRPGRREGKKRSTGQVTDRFPNRIRIRKRQKREATPLTRFRPQANDHSVLMSSVCRQRLLMAPQQQSSARGVAQYR